MYTNPRKPWLFFSLVRDFKNFTPNWFIFWQNLACKLGVGPKTETTEISAETETEISAEIDFGHINFSAEIFKSNYSINQDIFDKFNYFKVFQE